MRLRSSNTSGSNFVHLSPPSPLQRRMNHKSIWVTVQWPHINFCHLLNFVLVMWLFSNLICCLPAKCMTTEDIKIISTGTEAKFGHSVAKYLLQKPFNANYSKSCWNSFIDLLLKRDSESFSPSLTKTIGPALVRWSRSHLTVWLCWNNLERLFSCSSADYPFLKCQRRGATMTPPTVPVSLT